MKWIKDKYEKLYARAKEGFRTVCYIDYDFYRDGGTHPMQRDICTIGHNPTHLEFSSRGHGYSGYIEPDENELKEFISECKRLNVEWLDESTPASIEDEAEKLYPYDETLELNSNARGVDQELTDIQRSAHITCARMYTGEIERLKGLLKSWVAPCECETCTKNWDEFKAKHNL